MEGVCGCSCLLLTIAMRWAVGSEGYFRGGQKRLTGLRELPLSFLVACTMAREEIFVVGKLLCSSTPRRIVKGRSACLKLSLTDSSNSIAFLFPLKVRERDW